MSPGTRELAYEHNGRRVPRERFYEIACDPRRSVAVEACAGAGKTWMLVSRILRALMAGSQPHEILAITFTKKAAGEMRERLHQWLAEFSTATNDELRDRLRERGVAQPTQDEVAALKGLHARMLASGRPVQVRTFHSWFAALLRNAPLAVLEGLGLPANYELLESDQEAVDLVWRRFYAAVSRDDAARADYEASVAEYGRTQTQRAIERVFARRIEFALADKHGAVPDSVKPFGEQFPEFAGLGAPGDAVAQSSATRSLMLDAARALGKANAPTFSACGVQLERAVGEGNYKLARDSLLTKEGDQRKFSAKIEGLSTIREAQDAVQRIAAATVQHEAWLHQQRMMRLSRIALAEFAALKRDRGWVDMTDVERAALLMLSDPVLSGWVQERLDARTRHLLIDEFQDTNPLQWQALHSWLEGYAGAGDAPSVFIVGDPKQSIYRFRRAEPRVFRAAKDFIEHGLDGDVLSCDHTRRNTPQVLAAVNAVMSHAQGENEFDGFREHTTESSEEGAVLRLPRIERDAIAKPEAADGLEWRDSLMTPRELPEEKLLVIEARQAAAWIASLIAKGTKPGEIMVLSRKRDRLAILEDELRNLHVPAQQPERKDLGEAPEVQDIVALLDVLVSPQHDLSLARALKSPLFGFDDDALVTIALAARTQPLVPWIELLRGDAMPQPLRNASDKLAEWKTLVDELPPHDALAAIFSDGDVLAKFGAAAPAPLRPLMLARLRALLGAALDWNGGRYPTPYAFVRAMKAGGIDAPVAKDVDAVNLLTVHGAKGLEAPIVLLIDSDAQPQRADSMSIVVEWPADSPAPWRFSFIAKESNPPPCHADAMEHERALRSREELNMLYVAMTRAVRELAISSIAPRSANPGSWWQRLESLAEPIEVAPARPLHEPRAKFELLQVRALPTRAAAPPQTASADTIESRQGSAMHKLLETMRPGTPFSSAQLRRIAREFALNDDDVAQAVRMAHRIAQGDGAWAWDAAHVDWHGNEVAIHHEGELLRIDRLVRHVQTQEWWVLDYKSALNPQSRPELIGKMQRYRTAVQLAHPSAIVRAAFLTVEGRVIDVP